MHVWPSSPRSCRAFNQIVKLVRIDQAESTIVISGKEAAVEVCAGDRYFVENILEELDSPGEWYLDRAGRRLYLWLNIDNRQPVTDNRLVVSSVLDYRL